MSDPDQVPPGFEIKANEDSDLYHVPGSRYYDQTKAELWFRSIDAAEGRRFSHRRVALMTRMMTTLLTR